MLEAIKFLIDKFILTNTIEKNDIIVSVKKKIDSEKNEIIVGPRQELGKKTIHLKDLNLLTDKKDFIKNIFVKNK